MSTLEYVARGFAPTYRELLRKWWVRWPLFVASAVGSSVPIALAFMPGQAGEDLRQLRNGTLEGLWTE